MKKKKNNKTSDIKACTIINFKVQHILFFFSTSYIQIQSYILIFQGSRLDDQRCAPPPPPARGPTVPDEDFFSLIMRSQAKRMDEQRVTLPSAASNQVRANTNP